MMPARRWTSAIVVLALSAGLSVADPINPADVYVIDGDTIRVAGRTVRLVGLDAPKLGRRANECRSTAPSSAPAGARRRR
jgi:endonuclease YncB( thermonuclease family)